LVTEEMRLRTVQLLGSEILLRIWLMSRALTRVCVMLLCLSLCNFRD